jgi:D,D-heptose 1,7-bisphosphate phosphatase
MIVRQILFLVGGKGTRLGAVTANTPKPLLEIAPDIRFLDVLLQEAARFGFTDIILLAGHFGDQVQALYDGRMVGAARIRVIVEPSPAGTGGALAYARAFLDPWFMVANGDSFFQINLRAVAAIPGSGAFGRLALREVEDASRYGTVDLDGNQIKGFYEKDPSRTGRALINAGIYLLSRAVLDLIEPPCSIEQQIFPKLAAEGRLQGEAFSGYFLDIGLPDTYETARREIVPRLQRPAVFFDRDGVLNHDEGYTHRVEDLRWMEGAREAVRAVNDAGWLAIVVTNQAGIARGLYQEADLATFHEAMQSDLAQLGAHIDAFYHCPFHPDAVVDDYRHPNHPDRKPNPGMIAKAVADWYVIPGASILIGDQPHDLVAATRAGVQGIAYSQGSLLDVVRPFLKTLG